MGLSTTIWTIENLVFWDEALHGKVIESPQSNHPGSTKIQLYPKGLNGQDDVMTVRIEPRLLTYTNGSPFVGKLLVRNSHGKVMTKKEIEWERSQQFCEFRICRFSEVVIGSWEDESAEQENVRVECSINTGQIFNETYCMRTRVEVFDVQFKIPTKIMSACEFVYPVRALGMEYPRDELSTDGMAVFLSTDRNSMVQIELEPASFKKCIWAYAYLIVVTQKRFVEKEQGRYLFKDGKKWIFKSSFSKEHLQLADVELTVRVKIVPNNSYQHDSHFSGMRNRAATIHVFPTACYSTRKFAESVNPISLNQPGNSVDALTKDFSRLYRDGSFSDIHLLCGDVMIPVHKAILSSRSPIFKLFLLDPSIGSIVKIFNLDASTLRLLLSHLYTGLGVELNWESALKLYRAAENYRVPSLKARCSSVLGAGMCLDNVCDLLSLMAAYPDESLISLASKFFYKNKDAIMSSEKWKAFVKNTKTKIFSRLFPQLPTRYTVNKTAKYGWSI